MNVSLTEGLVGFVQERVKSGLYNSASEVVREALRLLQEHERIKQVRLEALKQAIQDGLNSGAPIPMDMDDVIQRGHERFAEKTGK